jgi:hypothetical protein
MDRARSQQGNGSPGSADAAIGALAEIDGRPMATLKTVTLRGPDAAADG